MSDKETIDLAGKIRSLLRQDKREELSDLLDSLKSNEVVYLMSKLGKRNQHKLLTMINPESAADVIEELPDIQAADLLEEMDAGNAAAIIKKLNSDDRADVFSELDRKEAEAILTEMPPSEAESLRKMVGYRPDTAGGLMITEYISYKASFTVKQVIDDLRKNAEKYKNYHVRYIYVVSENCKFAGVLQIQQLLLAGAEQKLSEIVITEVTTIGPDASLDDLIDLFDTYSFYGLPVVDEHNHLIGVVRRNDVLEARNERTAIQHLQSHGIVGGDELRSMPVMI
ncbi:MAG: magnesium transporter, partial [Bacteroidales bacterium]|nr:magnesium transporter [Bacteroidales bacterium]